MAPLFSFGDRVAFVGPVGTEVVGDVERLDVGEAHGVEGVIGRLHVGAVSPGAASAIDDDEFVARQRLDAGAETLERIRVGSRADVFGTGDMGLGVQDVRSDLDEERLVSFGRLKDFDQVVGIDEVRGCDLAGLEG